MTDLEQLWRAKSDEQVMEAGARLGGYTLKGQAVIRAELLRRGLRQALDEPQPAVMDGSDQTVDDPLSRYHTFGPRFWAGIVDAFVLMPVVLVMYWLANRSSTPVFAFLYIAGEEGALGVAYSILLHGLYGQTLGKKWLGVKVLHVNESRLTMRQAILRDSPLVLLSGIQTALGIRFIANGGDPLAFEQMGMPDFMVYAAGLWFLAEVMTMLTNEKRRALHDWIAGSVVVRVP